VFRRVHAILDTRHRIDAEIHLLVVACTMHESHPVP